MAYRDIILSKSVDYIRTKKLSMAGRGAIIMIDCPYCHLQKSAQIIPALGHIKCVHCQKQFNLIDLVRFSENKFNDSEETILNYIKELLNIEVQTTKDGEDLEKQLQIYESRNWALVPCAKAANIGHTGERVSTGKEVIQSEWQKKENRKPSEWFHWISSGLNIGVRTGLVSNLTIIDFDLLSKEEKAELVRPTTTDKRKAEIMAKKVIPASIKGIMGDTLIQESHGGFHAFYLYCTELRKTSFNFEGIHIDIENDLGQVIIPPSQRIGVEEEFEEEGDFKKRIVGYAGRKFINESPMIHIPEVFLTWLKEHMKPITGTTETILCPGDESSPLLIPEDFKVKDIQGNRNNTLLSLGGILRKELNLKQTGFALNVLNKHLLENPLPSAEITHILEGIDKYIVFDEQALANDIVAYLKETDTATKNEIESAVFGQRATKENKKRFDKTLMYLIKEEKIVKKNTRDYKILKEMEWSDNIVNVGVPIDFKMPYFHDYAYFNYGDILLVGGTTKVGKTHIAINMIKRLVEQGIKPRYIYNENGSRYAQTALQIGLKDGDFHKTRCINPNEIIMKPNSVYIYDWFRPNDFTKTAELFDNMADKLERANSIMICFAQLRDGTEKAGNKNEWFAKDQIRQFVSLSAKYLYDDKEGINTYFEVADVRDSKTGQKFFKIPCQYNKATKEILMQEELERETLQIKKIEEPKVEETIQHTEEEIIKAESDNTEKDEPDVIETAEEIKFDPNDM